MGELQLFWTIRDTIIQIAFICILELKTFQKVRDTIAVQNSIHLQTSKPARAFAKTCNHIRNKGPASARKSEKIISRQRS